MNIPLLYKILLIRALSYKLLIIHELAYFFIVLLLLAIYILLDYIRKSTTRRSTDVYQYKISNWYYTLSFIFFYITIFIFILFCLRIYLFSKTVDLKASYLFLYSEFMSFYNIDRYFLIIYFCIIVLSIINFFIIIMYTFNKQAFMLHIWLYSQSSWIVKLREKEKYILYGKIVRYFADMATYHDLLSYYIDQAINNTNKLYMTSTNVIETFLELKIIKSYPKSLNILDKFVINTLLLIQQLYYYIFKNKIYPIAFNLLPFLVVLYDCMFNNFILIRIYPFLVLYFPLALSKQIIKACNMTGTINYMLYDMYYKQPEANYFIRKSLKPLFDYYILTYLSLPKDGQLIIDSVYINLDIYTNCKFIKTEDKVYDNQEGIELQEDNGYYYERIYDFDKGRYIQGEEWVKLSTLRNNKYNNKLEIENEL